MEAKQVKSQRQQEFENGQKYVRATFEPDHFELPEGDREQLETFMAHCYAAGMRRERKNGMRMESKQEISLFDTLDALHEPTPEQIEALKDLARKVHAGLTLGAPTCRAVAESRDALQRILSRQGSTE